MQMVLTIAVVEIVVRLAVLEILVTAFTVGFVQRAACARIRPLLPAGITVAGITEHILHAFRAGDPVPVALSLTEIRIAAGVRPGLPGKIARNVRR